MRRRDFIAAVGGAVVLPLAAHGQSAMPLVGFLAGVSPERYASRLNAFRQGLGEAGYVEGRNVTIEYRWASDQYEKLKGLAAELVGRQAAVIATAGTAATLAAKAATTSIPVVFVFGADPVGSGVVANLSSPGGNLTGFTSFGVELSAKRVEIMRELLPAAKIIAVLINSNSPNAEEISRDMRAAAQRLNIQLDVMRAGTMENIARAFEDMVKKRVDGLVIGSDAFFNSESKSFAELTARYSLPAIFQFRDFVTAGGLMSYGGDITNDYRQAGAYAGLILKGQRPAVLPVLQSSKVELIVNLKTAKKLGIAVPQALLARADEVIE